MCKAYLATKRKIKDCFRKLPLLADNLCLSDIQKAYKAANFINATSPEEVADLISPFTFEKVEFMGFLCISNDGKVKDIILAAEGSANNVSVNFHFLFRKILMLKTPAVIFFHNHPSGDPEPSTDDLIFTRTLCNFSKILNIDILDHIVIAMGGFTSFNRLHPELFDKIKTDKLNINDL